MQKLPLAIFLTLILFATPLLAHGVEEAPQPTLAELGHSYNLWAVSLGTLVIILVVLASLFLPRPGRLTKRLLFLGIIIPALLVTLFLGMWWFLAMIPAYIVFFDPEKVRVWMDARSRK